MIHDCGHFSRILLGTFPLRSEDRVEADKELDRRHHETLGGIRNGHSFRDHKRYLVAQLL